MLINNCISNLVFFLRLLVVSDRHSGWDVIESRPCVCKSYASVSALCVRHLLSAARARRTALSVAIYRRRSVFLVNNLEFVYTPFLACFILLLIYINKYRVYVRTSTSPNSRQCAMPTLPTAPNQLPTSERWALQLSINPHYPVDFLMQLKLQRRSPSITANFC